MQIITHENLESIVGGQNTAESIDIINDESQSVVVDGQLAILVNNGAFIFIPVDAFPLTSPNGTQITATAIEGGQRYEFSYTATENLA